VAEILVPGSKSVTARALFLSACADGTSYLRRPLVSDDTEAFAAGLAELGLGIETSGLSWSVQGSPAGPPAGQADVYCRDSGTTARFLPTLAALGHGVFRFDASAQMRRRPMGTLVDALRKIDVRVSYQGGEGHLPFTVEAAGVRGGRIELDAGLSSQYLTGLLMAAPLMKDGLTIDVTRMVSAPYVRMTLSMMRAFGVTVEEDGSTYRVPPQTYSARDYAIEPDASSCSYFLAAAAVTGNEVTVAGLGSRSLQGDVGFARVLREMGADVEFADNSITVKGNGGLHGIEVNMRDISDTMPTLAAIAPFADGPVRITDVYNTRVKECDRLDASAANLRRLGINAETGEDWIEISPGSPQPGTVDCHGDHRIAMSFSVTGLLAPGIVLDDPACVRKTYPGFHGDLADLCARWDYTPASSAGGGSAATRQPSAGGESGGGE
jgi:3-phosphoshikimate 1-carboxyvinyltransferase